MGPEAFCAQDQSELRFQHAWLWPLVPGVEGGCPLIPQFSVVPLNSALPEHVCGTGPLLRGTQRDTEFVHWGRIQIWP